MGHQCCSKQKVKRGLWSPEEDEKLVKYITTHGHSCWSTVPKQAGLQRCGKSCRLRWINYLRPELRRGSFTEEEERIIIDVHRILGNRWAQIAKHLPGRTDNEVKNFWNSCIKKKLVAQGLDPKTHNLMPTSKSKSYNNNQANNASSQFPSSATPFTISSPAKTNSDPTKLNSLLNINPALLTLPNSNFFVSEPNISTRDFQFQEINGVLMSFKDQNPNPNFDFTNNAASCSYSSLDHATILSPPFSQPNGFIDNQSVVWAPNSLYTMDLSHPNEGVEPTIHALDQQHHVQSQNYVNNRVVDFNDATNEKGIDIDASYAGNEFDIELMESALMPCGMLYGGGNSMELLGTRSSTDGISFPLNFNPRN